MEVNKQTIYESVAAKNKKYSHQNYKKKHQYPDWYINYISNACKDIEKKYHKVLKNHQIPLNEIENDLYHLLSKIDLTSEEFKNILHLLGICLKTFHQYGDKDKLREKLSKNIELRIGLDSIKIRKAKNIWEVPGYPDFEGMDQDQIDRINYYTSRQFLKLYKVSKNDYDNYDEFIFFTKFRFEFLKSMLIKVDEDDSEDEEDNSDNIVAKEL